MGLPVSADWELGRCLSSSSDATLRLWDLESTLTDSLETIHGHGSAVTCVVVDWPSRRAITTSADQTVKLWDLNRSHCLKTLQGHSGSVMCIGVKKQPKDEET